MWFVILWTLSTFIHITMLIYFFLLTATSLSPQNNVVAADCQFTILFKLNKLYYTFTYAIEYYVSLRNIFSITFASYEGAPPRSTINVRKRQFSYNKIRYNKLLKLPLYLCVLNALNISKFERRLQF